MVQHGNGQSIGLKQYRNEGCLSYLVFERQSREAFFVDPRADQMDDYRFFLRERGLRPVFTLDTHLHSDHFSATHLLRREFGLSVLMSAKTRSDRPDRRLSDGDRLSVGQHEWSVMEVPGHTPDSIAIHGNGLVFTGDTIHIGSSGPIDSSVKDGFFWKSIRRILDQLPGSALLFPSHESNDLLFSTIETEKKKNPHYLAKDSTHFITLKTRDGSLLENAGRETEEKIRRVAFNLSLCPEDQDFRWGGMSGHDCRSSRNIPAVTSIQVEKYAHKLTDNSSVCAHIDVREPEEFEVSHIPGTRNIPIPELPFHLTELLSYQKIYVSCLSGRRSLLVANTLNYIGLPNVIHVVGGIHAWSQRGFPLNRLSS